MKTAHPSVLLATILAGCAHSTARTPAPPPRREVAVDAVPIPECTQDPAVASGRAPGVYLANEMGHTFLLERAIAALDGAPLRDLRPEDSQVDAPERPLWLGTVPAGEHSVLARLVFRLRPFGIYSYVRSIELDVRGGYALSVPEGRAPVVVLTAYERGTPTTPIEERLALRCAVAYVAR